MIIFIFLVIKTKIKHTQGTAMQVALAQVMEEHAGGVIEVKMLLRWQLALQM